MSANRPRTPRKRPGEEPRRNGVSLAVSIVLHAIVAVMVLQALMNPGRIASWLRTAPSTDPAERIVYVAPPSLPPAAGSPAGTEGPAEDDEEDEDDVAPPEAGQLVAPSEVPTGIPAPAPGAPAGTPGGVRGGVPGGTGRGTPTDGLVPRYTDPRLWGPVQPAPSEPRTTAQTIDSLIGRDLQSYRDSLMRAAEGRQPGDWTFGSDGNKWGIDPNFIRLGKVSIPTAVLGLLPLNAQGNPIDIERDRSLGAIRRQIDAVDRRQQANTSLKSQAQEIRARRDRERELRRQRERAKNAPVVAEPPDGR
jgi:hypothetical protein